MGFLQTSKIILSKSAYADFVLNFGSLRAAALKNPAKGLCPLTPPLLKKWTKLLIVTAEPLINNPIAKKSPITNY